MRIVLLETRRASKVVADFRSDCGRRRLLLPLCNRGIAYRLEGDSARAIADFNEVSRAAPGKVPASYERGLAYTTTGEIADDVGDVRGVQTEQPNAWTVPDDEGPMRR